MYPGPKVYLKGTDRQTISTGTGAPLTDNCGNQHGFVIKALCPAAQVIYVSGTLATCTAAAGYPMNDGETLTLEVQNENQIFALASAGSAQLAILPFAKNG